MEAVCKLASIAFVISWRIVLCSFELTTSFLDKVLPTPLFRLF